MAQQISQGNNKTVVYVVAGIAIVLVVALLTLGGGHNNGQPSAPSGPGNPMQTDQGR